jgi:LuxR family transcriptional regulator, maltose regulon positive regulatory protein
VTTASDRSEFLEAKLAPPMQRPGVVLRATLLDRLDDERSAPTVLIVGPAGYGKSTLLAQWAARHAPRTAWVSCDDGDNDPARLLGCVAEALHRVQPIPEGVFRSLAGLGVGVGHVAKLISAMAAFPAPGMLVLDHVEAITAAECLRVIAELTLRLPPGWRLALASRHELPMPVARLRAEGAILELTADDLAMAPGEASTLLREAGVVLDVTSLDDVMGRTEGWPAGLYLAALALRAGAPAQRAGTGLSGDDRFLGDYLRSEFLDHASPEDVTLMTRTAVLGRLSGPLCDAVVGRTGSGLALDRLERRNLLVVPLDRRRTWYRYHHLFRDLLLAELELREPEIVPALHARAAAWYEANGMPDDAIDHAQAAGDSDSVARLVLDRAQPVWAEGRLDTVLRWMEWLKDEGVESRYAPVAVHGCLIYALLGQPIEAERWADTAERASPDTVLADGSQLAGLLAYLRANLCRQGIPTMRHDAQLAWLTLPPDSPYRATMLHLEGLSHLLEADPDRADPIFAHALDAAQHAGALPLAGLVLAERCIVATVRDDWHLAAEYAAAAVAVVRDGFYDDYWTSALVHAVAARVAVHHADTQIARWHVAQAGRLRPLLSYALPVVSVQALLELTRAQLALRDVAGARTSLRQAAEILSQRPQLGTLRGQARELREVLTRSADTSAGASSLTTAELRLLPLLPTHLSLQQISDRHFLSRNTVKSQVTSIYRKLGASTREEAVRRAQDAGLLDR